MLTRNTRNVCEHFVSGHRLLLRSRAAGISDPSHHIPSMVHSHTGHVTRDCLHALLLSACLVPDVL